MHLPLTGGCQCGAVRYEIGAAPLTLYACHCTDCQRQSGGTLSLSMVVKRAAIKLTAGTTREWRRVHASGRIIDCYYCDACGTRLWHNPGRVPDLAILKAGTLDEARTLSPIGHIWIKSAQPWVNIPADAVNYDAQPPDLSRLIDAWPGAGSSSRS
jgi:hypothetical protein